MQLELAYDTAAVPYLMIFDESVLCQRPGFLALWSPDYPLEDLSASRKNATFGWINKLMRVGWNDEA
jgi:hypothetical protein